MFDREEEIGNIREERAEKKNGEKLSKLSTYKVLSFFLVVIF